MQFKESTGWRLLFKPIASCNKFVQPNLAANIFDDADKRVLRLHQRTFVSVVVAVVPSMSEKEIDVVLMLSAIIFRTDIKTMDF